MAGKVVAAAGVVLAFVAIWVDSLPGESYWTSDGTIGAFALLLACLAAMAFISDYSSERNGALAAVGALMLGFYAFAPAILAVDDWDRTRAGAWLALAAGGLILGGAGSAYLAEPSASTPGGLSLAAVTAIAGIALLFPGIFLDASGGESYWGASGHSLGIVMLAVAAGAALSWAAATAGMRIRSVDQALTLVALGLSAYYPVGAAWGDFGNLDAGAWLAFAGAILAAGGTWAARGVATIGAATASGERRPA